MKMQEPAAAHIAWSPRSVPSMAVMTGSGFSFFDEIFSATVTGTPSVPTADACLRRAAAGLEADSNARRRAIGEALDGASLKTGPAGDGAVAGSLAVQGSNLALVREHADMVRAELVGQLAHEGWELTTLNVIAAGVPAPARTAPPKKQELTEAFAGAVAAAIKSYDVEAVCNHLGLPPHPDPAADPHKSKAVYTRSRLHPLEPDQIVGAARRFLAEYDDPELEALVALYRPGGPKGTVKNLVFGSTKKPDLVLVDALSNNLGLVNPGEALLYDAGIPEDGLSWRQLVTALLPEEASADLRQASLKLYRRLTECLASEPERFLFRAYAERYGSLGYDQPALIPQVWLHYDPKAAWERHGDAPLARQRMDFLLLAAGRRRVVLEIDGVQHYSDNAGRPAPKKYGEMLRADRELRLSGYEVYRFGGAELPTLDATRQLSSAFFDQLLRQH